MEHMKQGAAVDGGTSKQLFAGDVQQRQRRLAADTCSFSELVPDEAGLRAYQNTSSFAELTPDVALKSQSERCRDNADETKQKKQVQQVEDEDEDEDETTLKRGAYDFTGVLSSDAKKGHVVQIPPNSDANVMPPASRNTRTSLFDQSVGSAMETRRHAPGAVAVRGVEYSDHGEYSGHTRTWEDPNVTSHSAKSSASGGGQLIAATLVDDDEPVVATRLVPSIWSDRRLRVAIVVVVLAAIGVMAWAFSRKDDVVVVSETPAPTVSPAPSFGPGRLTGKFCSEDPFNNFGGDYCDKEFPCQACATGKLQVCLGEGASSSVLPVYCETTLEKKSRMCGDLGECPLASYCIPCEKFTPEGSLEGHVCFSPQELDHTRNLQEQVETVGYEQCLLLADVLPTISPAPTRSPTSGRMDTPAPTPIVPTNEPTIRPSAGLTTAIQVEELLSSLSLDNATALYAVGTPQNRAFNEILKIPRLLNYDDEDIIQQYALTVFYFSTNGDAWRSSGDWLSAIDVCYWEFVTCTDGKVSSIVAPGNLISGPLPPEMYLLGSLVFLGLFENKVSSIPSELGLVSNLVNLDLDSNSLSDTIPTQLAMLSSAEYLYLNNNKFHGTIPSILGDLSMLHSLLLSSNDLTGSVPQEICDLGLANLKVLSVDVEVNCDCTEFANACHPVGST